MAAVSRDTVDIISDSHEPSYDLNANDDAAKARRTSKRQEISWTQYFEGRRADEDDVAPPDPF